MGAIVVTGASTGIGRACVVRLAAGGHRVFAGVRKDSDAEALSALSGVTPIRLDVVDAGAIADAAATVARALEGAPLTGLVNNAGVAAGGPIEFLPIADWRAQFEVNLFGVIAVTQAFLPALRASKGRIVHISSIGGRVSTPLMAPYHASKWALEALGDAMRQELRPFGIHTILVEPGAIATEIWKKGEQTTQTLKDTLPAQATSLYGPQIENVTRMIALQNRMGIPADAVAKAVERALTARWPRTRYLVGTDARVMALVKGWLPDRWLDALLRLT